MEQQQSNTSSRESQDSLPQSILQIVEDNLVKIVAAVVLILVILGVVVLITNLRSKAPFKNDSKVVLGSKTFKVKTAVTQKEKEIGLSGVTKLPSDHGMIFPFEKDGFYPFWMRDMKIPIDIIYINDGKIVQIFPKVPTPSDPKNLKVYQPEVPADTVLEINSGLSEKYKFKTGDSVKIEKS